MKKTGYAPEFKGLEWLALERYLSRRHHEPIELQTVRVIGSEQSDPSKIKGFGYGRPLLIVYAVGGKQRREVLHSINRNQFGRERLDDRVAANWLDYETFSTLPKHVKAVDLVLREKGGWLESIGSAESVHVVTEYADGILYADDLTRLRNGGELWIQDHIRSYQLAHYLADIHKERHDDPDLWNRRLRDLIGHGEGIMGQTDAYQADYPFADADRLRRIEERANQWRWKLKPHHDRLVQVHGDFHPFNILFSDKELIILDRSRGAWGAAADDVACLSINYIFFSLQRYGRLSAEFETLHTLFWETYFEHRRDDELLRFVQPWFAWRVLVLANPLWYPNIDHDVRCKLFNFADNVLASDEYNWYDVNHYLL